MLENVNDYLAILAIIVILAFVAGVILYFINLKQIEKNVRKEVKYYDYEKRK